MEVSSRACVGNPSLLEVNAKEDWDEMDNYTLEFSVCSKYYKAVREDNSFWATAMFPPFFYSEQLFTYSIILIGIV